MCAKLSMALHQIIVLSRMSACIHVSVYSMSYMHLSVSMRMCLSIPGPKGINYYPYQRNLDNWLSSL